MKLHSVRIERWDELCAFTPEGLAYYIDRSVRMPIAYKCSYLKRDGRVSRYYKPVSIVIYPWRSGANYGASVFIVGEGVLGRELRRLLKANLECGRYSVMWLDRPTATHMVNLMDAVFN